MSSTSDIYVGFWTNWSKGAVLGSTLTLANRNGVILVAALAIFIQIVGRQSWTVICFVTHQIRTTKEAKDGPFHQEQAVLRNNNSDINSLWQLSKIWWSWRSISEWRPQRSLAIIVVGLLHILAFGAAGILAFHITTAGNQVLLASSPSCGPWYPILESLNDMNISLVVSFQAYLDLIATASEEYVQGCLAGSQTLPECSKYQQRQLNWTSAKVICPFGDLCLGPTNSSLQMATSLLDSRADLGINGRDEDRIQLKKIATCVPITPKGYTKNGTTTVVYQSYSGVAGEIRVNYTATFYGPATSNRTFFGLPDPALENLTYAYTNFRDAATAYYNNYVSSYDLAFQMADWERSWASFIPIPELSVPNSTLELMFVSFYGAYTSPSDDLWMPAHPGFTGEDNEPGVTMAFFPDYTLSTLACTEQVQICNPSSNHGIAPTCTPLQSLIQINKYSHEDFRQVLKNDRQVAIAFALAAAAYYSSFYVTIPSLSTPLLAAKLSTGGLSMPIASNQWELESKNWFDIGLAEIQEAMVSYITGPPEQFVSWVTQNQGDHDPALKWLCENQIIRRNDFTNFSTLWISLIFGVGTLLICSTIWLESLVGWARYKFSRLEHGRWKQRAWWAEGILQLQRRVFEEETGVRHWKSDNWNTVPVTDSGRVWSSLKSLDEGSPLIQGQSIASEGKDESSSSAKSGTRLDDGDKIFASFQERPRRVGELRSKRSNSL